MSDEIKHECGIAFLRLLKPLEYYEQKYGSYLWGLNKLYLLMEKQHNRGQDGAGVAVVKMAPTAGEPFIYRHRSALSNSIAEVFSLVNNDISSHVALNPEEGLGGKMVPFLGELLLGHLRYATHSQGGESFCHPFIRANNWMSKNLVLAGNFNMTNNDVLFDELIQIGQHPRNRTDTVIVLEKIGHYLDMAVEEIYRQNGGKAKAEEVAEKINLQDILAKSAKSFDGGYAMCGLVGHGDAFMLRDPHGIRPAYYYADDEIAVAASERPAIQTAFGAPYDGVKEVPPGAAFICKATGEVSVKEILSAREKTSCSFERIYFSRGTDRQIYRERKELGRRVARKVLKAIDYDIANTVFSYIPNTAEVAYFGMKQEIDRWYYGRLLSSNGNIEDLPEPRFEKVAVKDAKLRTFITNDRSRNDLVSHVYDTTYGLVRDGKDRLVVIDDSIVRGTTLRESILRMLDRLNPAEIVIVSSAPQIRYPDCYGIDMSKLKDFVAFQAAIALLKERGMQQVIDEVYAACKRDENSFSAPNHVQQIYAPFDEQEISDKIAEMLTPPELNAKVGIIYQNIEDLHASCPNHRGDWYFTGNFPTPGGNRVSNRAFIYYAEGLNQRAY